MVSGIPLCVAIIFTIFVIFSLWNAFEFKKMGDDEAFKTFIIVTLLLMIPLILSIIALIKQLVEVI